MKKPLRLPARFLGAALLLAAPACTVYTPMQVQAPLVRARGEGEAALLMQASIRPELHLSYSPLNHVLLLANGSWRPELPLGKDGEPDKFNTRQYELGLGTYWPLGEHLTLTLAGGAGQAYTQRTLQSPGIFFGSWTSDYEARYRQHFGQISLAYQNGGWAVGAGYRGTQVQFTELTATGNPNNNASPDPLYWLPLDKQFRHYPYLFFRYALDGPVSQSHWQIQSGAGYAFCTPGPADTIVPWDPALYRANHNRGRAISLSLGIIYCLRSGKPLKVR